MQTQVLQILATKERGVGSSGSKTTRGSFFLHPCHLQTLAVDRSKAERARVLAAAIIVCALMKCASTHAIDYDHPPVRVIIIYQGF